MASSNLENAHDRDGAHSSQNASPYFQNTHFNTLDPALFLDDQSGSSGQGQFSHYPPHHLIGQDLAHPADYQHHLQQPQPPTFDTDWNSHILSNSTDEYSANFFESPYGQYQFQNSPYSTSNQDLSNQSGLPSSTGQRDIYNAFNIAPYQDDAQQSTVKPFDLHSRVQSNFNDPQNTLTDRSSQAPVRSNAVESGMHSPLPSGTTSGNFVITSAEDIEKNFRSQRFHNFVHIGLDFQNSSITKTALPAYIPRKSRNEITTLLKKDGNLKAKLNKRLHKSAGASSKIVKPRSVSIQVPKPLGVKKSISPSASDEESDEDDYSSDDTEEESIKPPLEAVRPSNASDGIFYDTTKALWRVPYRSASRDDIQTGLSDFWKIINTVRNRWKSDAVAVQEAEAASNVHDLPLLKERVMNQRQLLEVALKAALKNGHKDLIEHLGQHRPLMGAFAAALHDRAKDSDYNAELAKSILEILSKSASMIEKETLDKTSMLKIVQRFSKRSDTFGKAWADQILSMTSEASKSKVSNKTNAPAGFQVKDTNKSLAKAHKEGSNEDKMDTTTVDNKIGSGARASPALLAGAKRTRDVDGKNAASLKKPALGISDQATSSVKPSSARVETKQQTGPTTVKKVVPKQPNIFANLQPTYKKSVTPASNGSAMTARDPVTKSVPQNTNKAATQSGFSFAATMADLKRPKDAEPAPKKVESAPPETPEEKALRLRKEKRRSMRVSFKPEGELEEIRYFQHDPEEEIGHFASQVRDVRDLESEGRMFKMKQQAKQQQKGDPDKMDLDEDEDEEDEEEEDLGDEIIAKDYSPTEIDFTEIPDETRVINYAPFGGGHLEPDSPEAAEQRRREEETLVVVYSRTSEIPPSPKEPMESSIEADEPKEFGKVGEEWFTSRMKTVQGPDQAPPSNITANLSALLSSFTQRPNEPAQQPSQPLSTVDLDKILAQLNQPGKSQQNQSQQSYQDPSYPSMQSQPPQQQQHSVNPFQPQQYSNMLPAFAAQPQQSLSNTFSFNQPSAVQAAGGLDISSLLESHRRQFGAQAQAGSSSSGPENKASPHQSYAFENEDRRRLREGQTGSHGNPENQQQHRLWQNQNKKPRDPNRPTPKFVLPCKFWQEGKCTKGANCTYRHDLE